MASRALITYTGTGKTVTLTIEQSVSGGTPAFDETTIVQWATDNAPSGLTLANVRWSPEYEQLYP